MISDQTTTNNKPEREAGKIKQVVIMFDNSDCNELSLQTLMVLASMLKVKIRGLYIEDSELMNAVALPFAREITFNSASVRNIDVKSMMRHIHARASKLNKLLAEYATAASVEFSFETIQGSMVSIVDKRDMNACLVVLPAVKTVSIRSDMISSERLRSGAVACIYDGSVNADIALNVAILLAKKIQSDVLVLVTSQYLLNQIYYAPMQYPSITINIETVDVDSTSELNNYLKKYSVDILIAPKNILTESRLSLLQKSTIKPRYDIILVN